MIRFLSEIGWLLRKEVLLEWRQRYAISGILLYVLSTVFVVYISFINVQASVWNVLFWIIVLFASVNAVLKSFVQENSARQLYYYALANPLALLLAKIVYNTLLLLLLTLLCYGAFALFTLNPVKDYGLFFTAIFLGAAGFGITFTFVAAIAAKADNSSTLMAILSFPLVIPLLLVLVKISAGALRLLQDTDIGTDVLMLASIDLMLVALAVVLFPFLWRD